jgi:adenosylcobinamide-GDP ribazoletransferase
MRAALAFLTVLGGARSPEPKSVRWFPVIGALVGTGVGAAWWGAGELWPLAMAGALAVVADLVLTGALHFDGLADSADGLLPHFDRDRRLDVMATPDVGAFGVTAVASALILRVLALASMRPDVLLVAGLWCAARSTMAMTIGLVPYVRPGGLATPFAARPARAAGVVGIALGTGLAGVGEQGVGVVAAIACVAAAGAVVGLGIRRIGGFTGDVLGAAGVVGETAGLLVACARW